MTLAFTQHPILNEVAMTLAFHSTFNLSVEAAPEDNFNTSENVMQLATAHSH
jgi:hypothetical protein